MSTASAPRIQVFRPTMDEFKNFSEYLTKVESQNAHKAGLAKIIPPEEWIPRKKGYDDINLVIPAPISQVVTGRQGLYQQINIQQKKVTVKEFKKMAESNRFKTPAHFDYEDLERKYWKNITYNSPIYGADVSGSLYDDGVDEFNIQHLNTILDMVRDDYEIQIEGVNTAYLYFGMWKTTFAWHTEDMDLYSINYLHFGAPKTWYVIPPEHGRRLERLAAGFFNTSYQNCPAFLRHKMTIISPHVLKKFSIPYSKITQEPGEFMITFPFAYHSGFNHGYNCAESTNFALPRWVEYGKRSTPCTCRNDCVKICMDMFVKKFQPDRYELWLAGKDIGSHPEEPTKQSAAPKPNKFELAVSHQREERRREKELQKIKRHPITKVRKPKKSTEHEKVESDEDTQPYDTDENELSPRKKLKVDKDDDVHSKSSDMEVDTTDPEQDTDCSELEQIPDIHLGVGLNVDIITDTVNTSIRKEKKQRNDSESSCSEKQSTFSEASTPSKSSSRMITKELSIQVSPLSKSSSQVHQRESHSPAKKQMWNTVPQWVSQYPNLEKAIGSGIFSVSSIDESEPEQELTETDIDVLTPPTSLVVGRESESTFGMSTTKGKESNSTWRCEKINNLKMKFVIPKKKSQNTCSKVIESEQVRSQSPLAHLHSEKKSSTFSHYKKDHKSTFHRNENKNTKAAVKIGNSSRFSVDSVEKELVPFLAKENKSAHSHPKEHKKQILYQDAAKVKHEVKETVSYQSSNPVSDINKSFETTESQPKKIEHKKHAAQTDTAKTNGGKSPQKKKSPTNVSAGTIQRADDSFDSWAHPLKHLWHHKPKNFAAEVEFNQKLASIPPHCAVCVLFTPMVEKTSFPTETTSVPSISHVRMPAFCYGNNLSSDCILETSTLLRSDGTAPLLVCAKCKVCVHATCYGLGMLPIGSFTCNRCSQNAEDAQCCLCVLRGGVLKQTTDNRWAHIVCAVLIKEVSFENTLKKEPINVSKIPEERKSLKCRYCLKGTPQLENKGYCTQCLCGKCYLPYHVTCAYMAGVIFEPNDWPAPPNMICTKHSTRRKKPPKRQLTNISVGERVTAKHKNGIYYKAQVKRKYIQEYYSILFEDNSYSTNTLPEDIVGRKVTTKGVPEMNEKVEVMWTDNKIYNGTFKGSRKSEQYEVEFENGSILPQERSNIYAADEQLPKEVLAKLGHSSVSRNLDFSSQAEGKRVRVINQKYSQT